MNEENEFEIGSIISWMVGYVSVMKGNERLKEEVKRLAKLKGVSTEILDLASEKKEMAK